MNLVYTPASIVDEAIERRVNASLHAFRHALVPLYSHKIGRPEIIGTGVALAVGDERMLLTAAHVMRDFSDDTVFIAKGDGWAGLEGVAHKASTPGWRDEEDDRIDAAVFVLNASSRQYLPSCVEPDALLPGTPLGPQEKYILAGFPRSKLKYDFDRWKVTPRALRFVGRTSPIAKYSGLRARPDLHIVTEFHRERSMQGGRVITAPSVRGVSGGMLVWAPGIMQPTMVGTEGIAAIFIEWPSPRRHLISTRIDVHLALIRNHLPHVAHLVPEPKSIQARWHA